ncbi:MAG TPA: gas vesicle protein GvpJ [Acidimicrobiales bacterium]|nr:gas vesicle protein GvpJ [Acidimicrobiales bacterium]
MSTTSGTLSRAPRPSSLADVLDLILDKGLVIDAYVRVSLVGIEILTIDARIVVASVDTYLHFAEAVNRLDLPSTETQGLTELFGGQGDEEGEGAQEDQQDQEAQQDQEGHQDQEGQGSRGEREPSLAQRLVERGRWES